MNPQKYIFIQNLFHYKWLRWSFLLGYILMLNIQSIQAQSDPMASLTNVLPPSPDVAALGKYGEVPVNLNAGIPSIQVPLSTLPGRTINIPISLSYHAGGIKVGEISSWVGLGWTLSSGGMIGRSVRGLGDEVQNGYFNKVGTGPGQVSVSDVMTNQSNNYQNQIRLAAEGQFDLEPDYYTFSFLGNSGQFHIDENRVAHIHSEQDLRIEVPPAPSFSGDWIITTPDGTQYFFGGAETISSGKTIGGTETNISDTSIDPSYTSGWFLKRIRTQKGEEITFEYTSYTIVFDAELSESRYVNTSNVAGCPTRNNQVITNAGRTTSYTYLPSRIETERAVVEFTTTGSRQDLDGGRVLSEVIVKDKSNNQISKFVLNQGYFSSGSNGFKEKRLKLLSVSEYGSNSNTTPKVHSFYYNETETLPSRDSDAQDHWGFYNGQDGNTSLIPAITAPNGCTISPGNAIREADELGDYATAGMLNRIVYPTGGETRFEFEPHISSVTETVQVRQATDARAVYSPTSPSSPDEYTLDFTLTVAQCVRVWYNVDYALDPDPNSPLETEPIPTHFRIVKLPLADNNIVVQPNTTFTVDASGYITPDPLLAPGDYRIIINDLDGGFDGGTFTVIVYYDEETDQQVTSTKAIAGGVRIKKIVNRDGSSSGDINVRTFNYEGGNAVGGSITAGNYSHIQREWVGADCSGLAKEKGHPCGYIVYSSMNQHNMGTSQGNTVVYTKVTTNYGVNDEYGRKESHFIYSPNIGGGSFPYPPQSSQEWKRGQLEKEETFDKNGRILQRVENTYSYIEGDVLLGLKIAYESKHPCETVEEWHEYAIVTSSLYSGWAKLENTKTTQFGDNSGNPEFSQTQSFVYGGATLQNNRHYQVTEASTETSDGRVQTSKTFYPADRVGDPVADEMLSRFIIAAPLETRSLLDGKVLVASKTDYQEYTGVGQTIILPSSLSIAELEQPVLESTFNTNASNYYKLRLELLDYDTKGNLLSHKQPGGRITSYIWDYDGLFPVAKVENATYADLQARFGNPIVLGLGSTISPAQVAALESVIPDVFVTTFEYSGPLGAMSATTDVNGLRATFEYDDFNRLQLIKDHEGNIVKSYEYKYQNQP